MQNPFNTNANASAAMWGGQALDAASGMPTQRGHVGLLPPHRALVQMEQQLAQVRAQRQRPAAAPPAEPVVGYNPERDVLWSAGREFSAGNLSELDQAMQAGLLDRPDNTQLPPGFVAVPASKVKAEKAARAASRGAGHVVAEMGRGLASGVVDIPRAGLKAAAHFAPHGTAADGWLTRGAKAFDGTRRTPDTYGLGVTGTAFVDAAGSLPLSLALGAASVAAPVVGTGAGAALLYGSQAFDTYHRGMAAGLTHEAAMAAARKTGVVEAAGETLANRLGVQAITGAGRGIGRVVRGGVGYAPRVATDLLANVALQAGTEFGQAYAQGAIERDAGITDESPMDDSLRAAAAGAAMGALMLPVGAGVAYRNRPNPFADVPPPAPPATQTTPVTAPAAPELDTLPLPEGAQANVFGNYDRIGQDFSVPAPVEPEIVPTPDTRTGDLFPQEQVLVNYTPETVLAMMPEVKPHQQRAMRRFVQKITDSIQDDVRVDALIDKTSRTNMPGDVVQAVSDVVDMYRRDRMQVWAAEGIRRRQAGQRVGVAPVPPDATIDMLRAHSDALLDDLTTPDTIYATPNEMDVEALIPERRPPRPAGTPRPAVAPAAPAVAPALWRRFKRLLERTDHTLTIEDQARIEALLKSKHHGVAQNLITRIETDMRDGLYRRVTQPPSGAGSMAEGTVLRIARTIADRWAQQPRIVVLRDVNDPRAPERAREVDAEQRRRGATTAPMGFYYRGTVYLINSGLTTPQDVVTTMFHEGLGHYGLRGVFGDKLGTILDRLTTARPDLIQREAVDYGAVSPRVLAEEALTRMAETRPTLGVVQRAVAAIRTWLRQNYAMFRDLELTDAEIIRNYILPARGWVERGQAAGGVDGGELSFSRVAAATLPPESRAAVETTATIMDHLKFGAIQKGRRAVLSTMFLRDLARAFDGRFQRVTEHVNAVMRMSADAGDRQRLAVEVEDTYNILDNKEKAAVFDFQGKVLDAEVVIDDETDMRPVAVQLRAEFQNTLNEKQRRAYLLDRDSHKRNWEERGELLQKTANDVFNPLVAQAEAAGNEAQVRSLNRERNNYITEIGARINSIRGDYFPMMRFGDWSVVRKSDAYNTAVAARDSAFARLNTLLDRHDTMTAEERQALNRANRALKRAGANQVPEFGPEQQAEIDAARTAYTDAAAEVERLKLSEADYYSAQFESRAEAEAHLRVVGGYISHRAQHIQETTPAARQMLTRMEESLELTLRGSGNIAALRDAKRAMFQVYLASLPELSALKRQAKRKKIAGYHRDMQRNSISALLRDSFHLSRLKYFDSVTDSLQSVRNEADEAAQRRSPNAVAMQGAAAELERRHRMAFEFIDTPIQDLLAATTYIYFLGVSPGYLLTNLTQPFVVSMPMMMARHPGRALRNMGKAYADTAKMVKRSIETKGWRGTIDFENSPDISPVEKTMLRGALDSNLLSVTLIHDLATTADGRKTGAITRAMSTPAHHTEVMNRIATALIAFRSELASTGDAAAARRYAEKILEETHFDYSIENAPYWMKPGVVPFGKLLFQFKKYMLGMISLYAKTYARAFHKSVNPDPKDRAEAKRALFGLLTTQFAVAGAIGMPAAMTVTSIAQMVAEAFGDEPEDLISEGRNWLTDQIGAPAATAFFAGLPTLLGADMSRRLGTGDIINPFSMTRDTESARQLYSEMLLALAGPTFGGLLPRFWEGASFMAGGDFVRATESFMPKFIADVIRSGRFATEGVQTRGGDNILPETGAWDTFLTAAGLPAAEITQSYAAISAVRRRERHFTEQARDLRRAWVDGTPEERRAVEARIRTEVNPLRRSVGLDPITRGDLIRAARDRDRRNENFAERRANTANEEMAQIARFAQ